MKKVLMAIVLAGLCLPALAQGDASQANAVSHYVFAEFLPGLVKKKDGTQAHAQMNYNTLTEEMVFIKDTERLAMINLGDIDSVYVGGKVFVPVKNVFYERATNTTVALYVRNKANLLAGGKDIGYGAKSETSSIDNINALIGPTAVYKLQLPDGYKVTDHSTYWLNAGGKFMQLTNVKKLQSLFPAKADAIKNFVSANNISFNREADMVKLVEFCNQPG